MQTTVQGSAGIIIWKCSKGLWMGHLGTSEYGGPGLMVGLGDLRGLLQPKQFYDSMIVRQ